MTYMEQDTEISRRILILWSILARFQKFKNFFGLIAEVVPVDKMTLIFRFRVKITLSGHFSAFSGQDQYILYKILLHKYFANP